MVAVSGAAPQHIAKGQQIKEGLTEKGEKGGEKGPIEEGQQTVWHPLQITFSGPEASTTDASPNPFLDIRLQVVFTGPSGKQYDVPGFFAGDGRGGSRGRAWRVRFAADEPGVWHYQAIFRAGPGVAIDPSPTAGKPWEISAGTGSLRIAPPNPEAPGYLKWGRLGYVGKHYLKFQDGPYWLRGGTDSPENFLAYAGFAHTLPSHHYTAHVADWQPGDPDWDDGKGRGIIGALNYLASRHVNSIYFLTMNVGGDGQDVWPWVSPLDRHGSPKNDNLHFDTAKLDQWEIVFAHAQRLGIELHVVLNEAEKANKRELDQGELGPERKLYYREMIARFGHHLALQWNLCEEYNIDFDYGPQRVRAFAETIRAIDPYDHPITVHSAGNPLRALRFMFGDPRFDLTSIQCNRRPIQEVTEAIYRQTEKAGRPLPVSLDEFVLDRGQRAGYIPVDDAEGHRREKIWPTYFSGGMVEFILADLLGTDSFKTPELDKLWRYVWFARKFLQQNVPFWRMQPADALAQGGGTIPVGIGNGKTVSLGPQVLAKRGEVYAVYLPTGSATGKLDLSDLHGAAVQRWYNPRSGVFVGPSKVIAGSAPVALGPPPAEKEQDWVVLIDRQEHSTQTGISVPALPVHDPGQHWQLRSAAAVGLDPNKLDAFIQGMGGDGCIVRDGTLVKTWGRYNQIGDWASAAKPVLSTLLLLAVQEGKLASVDALVKDVGWPLSEKDAPMTFRHLANMVSGYACGEAPGKAWAYNDFAIQLYAKSLEKVFQQPLEQALRERLAALKFEDGTLFGSRHGTGVTASPRDFARLGWLWLNRGRWHGQQLLPASLMKQFLRPGVPADLPRSTAPGSDYLAIGSYGGGTNQTPYGPGGYGFNFWFNRHLASGTLTWPGLPADTFQANGMWNRDTVTVIPSLRMVVAVRGAKQGPFAPGDRSNHFNQMMALLGQAVMDSGSSNEK